MDEDINMLTYHDALILEYYLGLVSLQMQYLKENTVDTPLEHPAGVAVSICSEDNSCAVNTL